MRGRAQAEFGPGVPQLRVAVHRRPGALDWLGAFCLWQLAFWYGWGPRYWIDLTVPLVIGAVPLLAAMRRRGLLTVDEQGLTFARREFTERLAWLEITGFEVGADGLRILTGAGEVVWLSRGTFGLRRLAAQLDELWRDAVAPAAERELLAARPVAVEQSVR